MGKTFWTMSTMQKLGMAIKGLGASIQGGALYQGSFLWISLGMLLCAAGDFISSIYSKSVKP